jgi:hypothetical protein
MVYIKEGEIMRRSESLGLEGDLCLSAFRNTENDVLCLRSFNIELAEAPKPSFLLSSTPKIKQI